MNAPASSSDDHLVAELAAAAEAAEAVPASFLALGRAAYAWRTPDASLASLVASAAAAGVRADGASLRSLSFVSGHLTLEIEVLPDSVQGQIVPPQPGRIELQGRDGSVVESEVDDVGWFVLRPLPGGLARLYFRPVVGAAVVTQWVALM